MKKRRNLIIALLLVAALCLGIGYATLSRELIISSTANLAPNDSDFDIVFTNAHTEDEKLATASITGNGTTANYTILGLSGANDHVTLTFTITNKTTDVRARLVGVSQTVGTLYVGDGTAKPGTVSDWFSKEVTVTGASGTFVEGATDFIVEPGATATVTVKITLLKTVTEKVTLDGSSIHLNFEDANGN